MWNYKNGLPPLEKPILKKPINFQQHNSIYSTDIDGFPYFLIVSDELKYTNKFVVAGQLGLYTLKSYKDQEKILNSKMDKIVNISDRKVESVKEHYAAWGMKKEAEKIKTNYRWDDNNFYIEGKLSKNQVIQYQGFIMKITHLEKDEDGIINIYGEHIDYNVMIPIYPYKKNGVIIEWYYDMLDVWLRQVKEIEK